MEVGYFGATAVLCGLLWLVYRRGDARVSRAGGLDATTSRRSAQIAPAASTMLS